AHRAPHKSSGGQGSRFLPERSIAAGCRVFAQSRYGARGASSMTSSFEEVIDRHAEQQQPGANRLPRWIGANGAEHDDYRDEDEERGQPRITGRAGPRRAATKTWPQNKQTSD